MKTKLSVAVVVCAYTLERWDDLAESIASAADQAIVPGEILLVVDHNADLLERAKLELTPRFPSLRIVANRRKQGLSGARNTALEEVRADVVVFLDDDAAAAPGWLAALLAPYESPSVMAVGGAATPKWPSAAERPVTLPLGTGRRRGELDWVVGSTYEGQPEVQQPVRNLMGCNMSFRRSVFAAVGGFSEDLGRVGKVPLGCEETELCIRARTAFPHAEIVFAPDALVIHRVSPDRLTWTYLRSRSYAEGLSKAAVAGLVGQDRALETERAYVARVLPRAVVREVLDAVRPRGDRRIRHALNAFAVVFGLGATTIGYLRGRLSRQSLRDDRIPSLDMAPHSHASAG